MTLLSLWSELRVGREVVGSLGQVLERDWSIGAGVRWDWWAVVPVTPSLESDHLSGIRIPESFTPESSLLCPTRHGLGSVYSPGPMSLVPLRTDSGKLLRLNCSFP